MKFFYCEFTNLATEWVDPSWPYHCPHCGRRVDPRLSTHHWFADDSAGNPNPNAPLQTPHPIVLGLEIYDGALNWDADWLHELEEEDSTLKTWLENCATEDLMHGTWKLTMPATVEWFGEEGPRITP